MKSDILAEIFTEMMAEFLYEISVVSQKLFDLFISAATNEDTKIISAQVTLWTVRTDKGIII